MLRKLLPVLMQSCKEETTDDSLLDRELEREYGLNERERGRERGKKKKRDCFEKYRGEAVWHP